jgi:hypothetical protein
VRCDRPGRSAWTGFRVQRWLWVLWLLLLLLLLLLASSIDASSREL